MGSPAGLRSSRRRRIAGHDRFASSRSARPLLVRAGQQRVIEEADDARFVLLDRGSLEGASVASLCDLPQCLRLMSVGVVDAVEALVVEAMKCADQEDGSGRDASDP